MSTGYEHPPLPPLPPAQLAMVTMALTMAVFMNVLDVSIANVSIPTISGYLGVSPDHGTWIITSFAVCNAISVPIAGWLARSVGEVRLFVISATLFTLFSFLCGFSFTFPMLLTARALQGLVAGPMIPMAQSLLLSNYPKEKHGFANGIWGMTAIIGPVAGPVLGGWITDDFSWRWIFYINLPFGLFSVLGVWLLLRDRETPTERQPVDVIGLALLAIGIGSLQVMLDQGNDKAWFNSNLIIGLGVIAAFALSLLVAWELTDEHPLIDLRLFKRRNFAVATAAMTLGYMAYFAGVVLLPLWLQTTLNYDPTWAGLTAASLGIVAFFMSPVVGRLTDRFDPRLLVSIGMLIFSALSFVKSDANTGISFQRMFLERLPWGIGMALFFIPLITLAFGGLQKHEVARASSLFNFMRGLALSVGTSISIALWDSRQAFHDDIITSNVSAGDPVFRIWLAHAEQLGFSEMQAMGMLAHRIKDQAFMLGLNEVYWGCGWLFLVLAGIVWLARREKAEGPPPSAGH